MTMRSDGSPASGGGRNADPANQRRGERISLASSLGWCAAMSGSSWICFLCGYRRLPHQRHHPEILRLRLPSYGYPRQTDLPALDILRSTTGNEVNTEMGMLRSRTLALAVADSLVMQVAVDPADRVARADLFPDLRVDSTGAPRSAPASSSSSRTGDGFRLREEGAAVNPAILKAGDSIRLGSLSFRLAPAARSRESIRFEVQSIDVATDRLLSGLEIRPAEPGSEHRRAAL